MQKRPLAFNLLPLVVRWRGEVGGVLGMEKSDSSPLPTFTSLPLFFFIMSTIVARTEISIGRFSPLYTGEREKHSRGVLQMQVKTAKRLRRGTASPPFPFPPRNTSSARAM